MALSISDFSGVSGLSPQTLRYYHAEGLLVPVDVDEQTGYRSYAFEQVERAALVSALRRAGLSVRDVRAAVGAPDVARALLQEHRESSARRREREDAALREASVLLTDWPSTHLGDRPAMTVVSVRAPGEHRGEHQGHVLPEPVSAAARDLAATLRENGVEVVGSPWAAYSLHTPEQRAEVFSPAGPDWEVAVAVAAIEDGAVPGGARLCDRPAQQEVSLTLPARASIAVYAAAVHHILRQCLERGLVPDLAVPHHVLGEDGTTIAVHVRGHDERSQGGEPAGP